jgi:ComF family protein
MISRPWSYRLYRTIWSGLDLLYPLVCGGCGQAGFRWCPSCQERVITLSEPLCKRCGLPQRTGDICKNCMASPPAYSQLRSWLAFDGPIRKALYRLKYRRDLGLGDALAEHLTGFLTHLIWSYDFIVPVLLGRKRLLERGYNQVSLVARPLALAFGKDFLPNTLLRVRETASRVGLSAEARHVNVHDAFRADRKRIQNRSVLLMDDVATTGATLSACASAIKDAGALDVYALTIARALPPQGLKCI